MELIANLPSGPLDAYRDKASFNWKKMKLYLEDLKVIRATNEANHFIENEPVFQHPDHELTLEEERHLTFQRMMKVFQSKIFYPNNITDPAMIHAMISVVAMYDWSLLTRKGLLKDFPLAGINGLGTERHFKYISALLDSQMGFAFCLTEMAHGSNSKALRTEARYDKESKSFIIHTPDFEAAKCWAGCLGKTASHCLVFAQLYTPDGECHGLNCFIVPVRDPQTLQPYTGVTIFDMGPKVGLNGLDNGGVIFNHYAIPKENLLNKTGDVTDDGKFVTPYKDPNKRFGASLGNLSLGRVGIISFGIVNLTKALTISIRYSAVRKQFGPDEDEIPVLEYPLQQYRLFPYLAGLYALDRFYTTFQNHQFSFFTAAMENKGSDLLASFGQEIHALSCVGKPISGWMARDAIQESREACGGHGYLKVAGFLKIRNDNDASCTYEGDNNVLLQQTSNWLLSLWSIKEKESCRGYPMGTVTFMDNSSRILNLKWDHRSFAVGLSEQSLIDQCIVAYEWLVCWLCKVITEELKELKLQYGNMFTARSNCQVFRAHTLSLAYGERVIVSWFYNSIRDADRTLQPPLYRLCALFSLTRMSKHLSAFVEGGLLLNQGTTVRNIQNHIKRLLTEILPDSVALIDVFAPPDFFLQSALGNADGKVYDHLYQAMITAKGALTRDPNWNEMKYKTKSKL